VHCIASALLSKAYLRGESASDKALVPPPGFYEQRGIDTLFGIPVVAVDTRDRFVMLPDRHRVPFDALLLATGARNRRDGSRRRPPIIKTRQSVDFKRLADETIDLRALAV
jgi:NADPH-dependent 2,4-dienoyl-CoA reductase/sulfur reductase-like enzyme